MKTQTNISNSKSKKHVFAGTTLAALALCITIPLSAGEKKHSESAKADADKQYASEVANPASKQSSDGMKSATQVSPNEVEELQYSMEDGLEGPKEGETQHSKKDKSHHVPADLSKATEHDLKMKRDKSTSTAKSKGQDSFTAEKMVSLDSWHGTPVVSNMDEDFGEVEDVVANLNTGEVTHLLVDNDGLFTGSSLIALGHAELQSEQGRIVIETATAIDEPDVKLLSSERFCSELTGSAVEDMNGEKIGKIDRVVIAPNSVTTYAIVSNLKSDIVTLEGGAKSLAVPVKSLSAVDDNRYRTRFAAGELRESAPVDIHAATDWSAAELTGYIVIAPAQSVAAVD